MSAKEIVLVEDDDTIRENYVDRLEAAGFKVRPFGNRRDAEQQIMDQPPDLALLDIRLHEEREGGFDLCRTIRKNSETLPIIFLTSYDNDMDEISALRLGADDFISKEESIDKILVRINALLRRVSVFMDSSPDEPSARAATLAIGDLVIDMSRHTIRWKEHTVRLPLTQLWILHALASSANHLLSREEIMSAANITHSGTGTVPVHINAIRNKFKEADAEFDSIENERGVGYRWRAEQTDA